jgi:hypothetical protein
MAFTHTNLLKPGSGSGPDLRRPELDSTTNLRIQPDPDQQHWLDHQGNLTFF